MLVDLIHRNTITGLCFHSASSLSVQLHELDKSGDSVCKVWVGGWVCVGVVPVCAEAE